MNYGIFGGVPYSQSLFDPRGGLISAVDYGCTPNAPDDQGVALQRFFDACSGKVGILPPGAYLHGGGTVAGRLLVRPNSTIYGYGATIKAAAHAPQQAAIYIMTESQTAQLNSVIGEHVLIEGLAYDGNRAGRAASGEAAGFYIYNAQGVTLRNCTSKNNPSGQDGFYLGGGSGGVGVQSQFCTLENLWADNTGRNGLSIVGAAYCKVVGGWFTNSNQASPKCGIDLEPDGASSSIEDCLLIGVSCVSNGAHGINIHGSNIARCAIIHPYVAVNATYGIIGGVGTTIHFVRGTGNGTALLNGISDSS